MQNIKTYFKQKYNFVTDTIKIYEHFSEIENNNNTLFKDDISYNFKEFVDFVYENGFKQKYNYFEYIKNDEIINNNPSNKEKVLLFFSGGKDSVYCALKLKEKYDVTLYFLKGINKSYPDEVEKTIECAKLLNLPLIIEKISMSVKATNFLENPIKNMVIYACGLNYGLEKGITTYCFGNHKADKISNAHFDRNYSDTIEMFSLYEKCINKYLTTKIKTLCIIENYYDVVHYMCKQKKFYNVVQSCMMPHRFRNYYKIKNEKKYNVKLYKYNCGSCWKCCVNNILSMDLNYMDYNKDFYNHCLNILKNKVNKESNYFVGNKTNANVYISFLGEKLYKKSKLKTEEN